MRWLVVLWLGCRSAPPAAPAGGSNDDGAGELAQASALLLTSEGSGVDPFAPRPRRDDGALGGTTYGNYVVPTWPSPVGVHRTYPRHQQVSNLAGAIEGRITWRGAVPGKRATACGPRQLVHVGEDRGVADVVIYIDQVKVGRTMPTDGHVAQVGGALVKRDCMLRPTAQIVTPLPAAVVIHGDPTRATLTVTPPDPGEVRTVELEEGGRYAVPLVPGLTRVEAADGSLGAAWVLASDAPYFAITDDHGRFRIDELAPGTYEVTIWHPPLPNDKGPLVYGLPLVTKRSVTVGGTKPVRLDVAIGR